MSRRRVVVTVAGIWIAGIAVAAELVALRGPAPVPQVARTFRADVEAAGLQSIELTATDGTFEVMGTDEERIRISAEVSTPGQKRRWSAAFPADLARTDLMTGKSGNVFTARVRVPGNDAVVERWTVRVPRRFKVILAANDGAIRIADVSGGVSARANAGLRSEPGSIRVNVPGGRLDLSLHVGEIHAETSSTSRGPVDVASSVGDARLTLAGRTIAAPREAGPGQRVRLNDTGPDAITLHVGVGTATLDIK
jgi:hypothetical protein